jgi:hypothetical protein
MPTLCRAQTLDCYIDPMLGIALPTLFALASAMPQADAEKPKHPAPLVPVAGQVEQPVELGQVKWRRDFEAGLAEAKRTGRPVLLLFQEVPG